MSCHAYRKHPDEPKAGIDYRLVATVDYLPATAIDVCIPAAVSEQPHWLEANPCKFRTLEDVEIEAAQLAAPGENKNNVEAALKRIPVILKHSLHA